jgi:hypothetical protein
MLLLKMLQKSAIKKNFAPQAASGADFDFYMEAVVY